MCAPKHHAKTDKRMPPIGQWNALHAVVGVFGNIDRLRRQGIHPLGEILKFSGKRRQRVVGLLSIVDIVSASLVFLTHFL